MKNLIGLCLITTGLFLVGCADTVNNVGPEKVVLSIPQLVLDRSVTANPNMEKFENTFKGKTFNEESGYIVTFTDPGAFSCCPCSDTSPMCCSCPPGEGIEAKVAPKEHRESISSAKRISLAGPSSMNAVLSLVDVAGVETALVKESKNGLDIFSFPKVAEGNYTLVINGNSIAEAVKLNVTLTSEKTIFN